MTKKLTKLPEAITEVNRLRRRLTAVRKNLRDTQWLLRERAETTPRYIVRGWAEEANKMQMIRDFVKEYRGGSITDRYFIQKVSDIVSGGDK